MKINSNSLFLTIAALVITVCPSGAKDAHPKALSGEQIFKQYCANCHAEGGNKVNPDRPVAGSSKLVTEAIFKSYLNAPPGHMPYYQHVVNDQQLLEALYKYCKELKHPTTKQACASQ